MRPHHILLLFCPVYIFFITLSVNAQNLELKYAEFKEDKLVVHYSLTDSVIGRFYTVRLYASKDNFLNPLEKISGDIGLEVKPGPDNQIIWDARTELGASSDGKVSLEIRGRIFIPFINTGGIDQYKIFKRGRKYNITWSGGSPQNILNFDLYHGEKKITSFPNLANVGHHSFEFPTHVRPGKGYRFKISDAKNKEEEVYTDKFSIKRKFPLALKALPVLLVGSSLYLLIKPKDNDPDLPRPLDK
jgi:hypothetical protein